MTEEHSSEIYSEKENKKEVTQQFIQRVDKNLSASPASDAQKRMDYAKRIKKLVETRQNPREEQKDPIETEGYVNLLPGNWLGHHRLDDIDASHFLSEPEVQVPVIDPAQKNEQIAKGEIAPPDLPEDHFKQLSQEEYLSIREAQWKAVENLDDNDPRKILYFRRFDDEFRSSVPFDQAILTPHENPYRYYVVDTSKMSELPRVAAYKPTLAVPDGKKVGIIIGYHHLEKPYGHLFREMFQQQAQFDQKQIEFIVIQNKDIPTGEESASSDEEIQKAVKTSGLTHIIDNHEQLARSNSYFDAHENPQFRDGQRYGIEGEYLLDPDVPTWMIEQYYQGHIYPQLQYAINDQIKKVETLIRSLHSSS